MQITLLITIVLVVMVIFVFLRSFWATIIPSVTVPLALLGACALMWAFGYTLDNLSLMALTIAVGFVVDDAIVMLENITRYIEDGREAAGRRVQGRQRNRLHHRLDQRLAGRGADPAAADGRHHRPAVPRIRGHAGDGDLRLAGGVADADADDGVALPARATARCSTAGSTSGASGCSSACCNAYERGLDLALRCSLTTLCIFFATVALSVYLFVIIPKGFFPQQDNGILTAVTETPQDISFAEMKRRQEELGEIVQADPAVDSIAMFIGGGGTALNTGRMYITLKPRDERDVNAQQIIARLRPKLDKVEGARLYPAGVAGRAARRPRHAHAVRVHAAGRQSRRAQRMGAEDPGEDADAAAVARRRHRPADRGHDADAHDRSRHRRRATASSRS